MADTPINIIREVRCLPVNTPDSISKAIVASREVSEQFSGKGESQTLEAITVTIDTLNAWSQPNLIPNNAQATIDIRIPAGISVAEIEAYLSQHLEGLEGVSYEVTRRYEPNWTDPDHEIIGLTADVCEDILGARPVVNMRVGASDARLYRYASIPSVVCGLTPYNMGADNEYVLIDELKALGQIFTETAFRYLQA